MHKEKLPRATHGGMAGQRDAARARGRRTRVHARVLTWSRSRPGTMLPARLHLEHAARQAASEALGQPGACCWLASDLGMVEHSCGASGGGDGRLVAPRSALVAASRVAQREEQLSSKSRWAAIVRRREGATAVFRRRCRSWPATRKLFAGGVTADRNVTAGSGVATRSGLFGESQVSAPRVGRGRNRASRPDRPLSRETSIAAKQGLQTHAAIIYLTRAWEREKLGSIEHRPRVEPPARMRRAGTPRDSPPHRSHAFQGTTIKSL